MTSEPTDTELASRGLYDPDSDDAAERLELIRFALRLGATVDELATGNVEDIILRLLVRPGHRYTLDEAAQRAGTSSEHAKRLNRAFGFADPALEDRVFTDADIGTFAAFSVAGQVLGEEQIVQMVRVVGSATARIADAAISTFAVSMGKLAADRKVSFDGVSPLEVARANESALGMLPYLAEAMEHLLRRHIEANVRTEFAVPTPEESGTDVLDRAIGFCDLVGYTALTGEMSPQELNALVGGFGVRASDVVTAYGGSVVKLIGDEVMFVAVDAALACRIGVALASEFDADPALPKVRVGLASGRVVLREGDYHGPVVNLAARLVKVADPGQVIAPAAFRHGVVEGRSFEVLADARTLKGFDAPIEIVSVR